MLEVTPWRKFLPLSQAVSDNLKDGDTAAFEGFTHLIPTAAAHEAIRQGFKDLTLVRMTPDLIYDQMIGMGMARKAIFPMPAIPASACCAGCATRWRTAFRTRWRSRSTSHAAMANAYEAGAAGLPCAIFRGYRGAGLAEVNREHQVGHLPVHRREPGGRAGGAAGRDLHPCPKGRPQRQCAGRRHRRHPEGGGAGGQARRW